MMFQAPSPHLLPQTQVSSFHHLPPPQVTSPHLLPDSQVPSPYYPSHPALLSPHLIPQTQTTPPHLYPHPQVTSSHYELQPQVSSPHLLSPAQQHLYNQNQHPGLPDPPPELSYLQQSFQNQSPAHLDLQTQTQFREDLSYNTHTLFDSGVYRQVSTPGSVQDPWRPLESPLPQFQCSPLGPGSGEVPLGGWGSLEYGSSAPGNFNQFFQDGYQDHSAPQPFCSPNTPGPSPHYPQTPTISSPGPQMIPREERGDFNTSRTLSRDKTFSCFLQDQDRFPLISDPHQTSTHLLQSHTEQAQDQTALLNTFRVSESRFSPQDGTRAAPSPGVSARPGWRDGGGGPTDWTKVKPQRPENKPTLLNSRLLCVVCKRDFRSLPALNGHMRSHSGSRSASGSQDSGLQQKPSVSMVMPVSVPVQSRGPARAGRSAQKSCSGLVSTPGGAVLYGSVLHGGEKGDGGEDGGEAHYTPPPMLCPLRPGPGLFCSLSSPSPVRPHGTHTEGEAVAVPTASVTPGTNQARINVGRGFQAEIPPLSSDARSDSHDALLLWTPLEELEHPVSQQRVEALMKMACSSVMPGGGASSEAVLQVLSESRGDFLLTMERLLSNTSSHSARHKTSVCWSAAERKLLIKSLQLHHKDFRKIQKTVQSKSLPQCVEFYYQWKKKLSLSTKAPPGLTVTLPDPSVRKASGLGAR